MANPDQKTLFYEEAYKDLNQICIDFQENCGANDKEIIKLLREILLDWGKKVNYKIKFNYKLLKI